MTDYNGLSAERVIEQISKFKGNITMVATAMHCSRQTIYNYIRKRPTIEAALKEARETMIDNVESTLYSKALEGEAWAVCFFLKTQAKHRGYIERVQQEVSGRDGGPLEFDLRSWKTEREQRLQAIDDVGEMECANPND